MLSFPFPFWFPFHPTHASGAGKVICCCEKCGRRGVVEGGGRREEIVRESSSPMQWNETSTKKTTTTTTWKLDEKKSISPHVVQRVFHATWMHFSTFSQILLNISIAIIHICCLQVIVVVLAADEFPIFHKENLLLHLMANANANAIDKEKGIRKAKECHWKVKERNVKKRREEGEEQRGGRRWRKWGKTKWTIKITDKSEDN